MSVGNSKAIRGLSPSLRYLIDFLSFFQNDQIKIPLTYREKVLAVKRLLNDDPSGLPSSILDYAINSALVDYRIETDNPNLTKALNKWLEGINSDLIGKVPTGLQALAKEYFRERWKGSSNLLLRTFWNEKEDLMLPTSLFFVDGEDIKVKSKNKDGVIRLGEEQYYLRVTTSASENDAINNKDIPLPSQDNEVIFSQKPYESWGTYEPTPYLIKTGVFRNSEFLKLITSKGEFIVSKALEYLLIIKKGTENLAMEGHVTYDKNDLQQVSDDLRTALNDKRQSGGLPSFVTNFDTDISDYIPDYTKIINTTVYSPIEQRILAGLGLVDVVTNVDSNRKESLLNPKPFMTEVEQGINDFKALLADIIKVFIEKNATSHKKWMSAKIQVTSSPIKNFIDDKFRAMLRSIYDRGALSKRTMVELGVHLDFDLEVQRRKEEKELGLDEILFPPVIQNQMPKPGNSNTNPDTTLPDRTAGPETKNFNQSWEEAKNSKLGLSLSCSKCHYEGDLSEFLDNLKTSSIHKKTVSVCPSCKEELLEEDVSFLISSSVFEQAPYQTNQDLPEQVKVLPGEAQSIWKEVFNKSYPKGEDYARKVAWTVVKKSFKKSKDGNWFKKSKATIEKASNESILENLQTL